MHQCSTKRVSRPATVGTYLLCKMAKPPGLLEDVVVED